MDEHIADQLPFYEAGTLPVDEQATIEKHLSACSQCRADLREWERIAGGVRGEADVRKISLPPLSPVVRASLRRRPTLTQAIHSTANLIWAQRVVVTRNGVLPAVLLVILLAVLATFTFQKTSDNVALPLLVLVPIVAALVVSFLCGPEADPIFELLAAAPTPPGTLVFARLTLTIGLISGFALLASLFLSVFSSVPLVQVVGAWLGPMLLLSALTTLLSLIWSPMPAASVTLWSWGMVVFLLIGEQTGIPGLPLFRVSLQPLLQPEWRLLGTQMGMASLLWLVGWLLLSREAVPFGDRGINR